MPTLLLTDRIMAWLRRYLPAELLGTIAAITCAWAAITLTGSAAAAAIAGTWGENLAFYGLMLGREMAGRGPRALPAVVRDLMLEFGLAEALDSLLLRPGLMYAGMTLLPGSALGLFAGKLAADLVFYLPTIVSYELLRRARRPVEELPL